MAQNFGVAVTGQGEQERSVPTQITLELIARIALDLIEKDSETFAYRESVYFGRQRQVWFQRGPRHHSEQRRAVLSLPDGSDATLILDDGVQLMRVAEPGLQEQSAPLALIQIPLQTSLGA
jgi:hypothetical protein